MKATQMGAAVLLRPVPRSADLIIHYTFKFRNLRNLSVIRLGSLRSLGYEVIKLPSEYRLF